MWGMKGPRPLDQQRSMGVEYHEHPLDDLLAVHAVLDAEPLEQFVVVRRHLDGVAVQSEDSFGFRKVCRVRACRRG